MSRLVVDASTALYLATASGSPARDTTHDLWAPALLWSEAQSVLRERCWRGDISDADAAAYRARLFDLPIRAYPFEPELHSRAWDVAKRLGWPKTYDAEYVALAQALDCPLLTVDARLARGASRLIRLLAPTDL